MILSRMRLISVYDVLLEYDVILRLLEADNNEDLVY